MKRILMASAAVAAGLCALPAQAEDLPWNDAEVHLVARQRPMEDFLKSLFAAEGLPVAFDGEIEGKLNGEFSGTAQAVFERVAAGYDIVPYWDGSTVRISSGADIDTMVYQMSPDEGMAVRRTLDDLAMGDAVNTTRQSAGVFTVSGTPSFRRAVDGVIRTQDVATQTPANAMVTKVFPLKYAWAHDTTRRIGSSEVTVPGVATILRAVASGNGDGSALSVQVEKRQLGLQPLTEVAGSARPTGQQAYDPRRGGAQAVPADFEPQPTQFAREAQPLPGGMTIEADPRLNTIIIRDRAANMEGHAQTIEQLDVAAKVVVIEATIIDVDTNQARELGLQWAVNDPELGINATQGGRVTRGIPLSPSNIANPFAGGLLASGVVGGEDIFAVRLAALEREGVAKIVSRPQVMTLENVEAVFDNTETFFARVESDFDATLYQVTVGTILSVTPDVVEEDGQTKVKLLASVADGRVTGQLTDGLPRITNASVGTQGTMNVGQTLLFGGLTVDRDLSFEDRVPVVSKIPLVGGLFKQKSKSSQRVERMFLLTPRLVEAGPSVAVNLDEVAPVIGQAAPDLYQRRRPEPRPAPQPQPQPQYPERQYEERPVPNEVSATSSVVTSNGLEVTLTPETGHAPILRGGQLFTDDCDDLDPYAACEDEA